MICPSLADLPSPPAGKIGWPWTEESGRLAKNSAGGKPWPRISVITPSFNQGQFLEETIRSILLQGYPDLDYLVFDGGSTDGSVEIIKKYSPWIGYWVTQPDAGQSDAINRGLKRASGDYAAWINSDDLLCKNALVNHVSRFDCDANIVFVGICEYISLSGQFLFEHQGRVHSLDDLLRISEVWRSDPLRGHIVQPEVLFPRDLALAVGGLNTENHRTMDYELWGNLFLAGATFRYTDVHFGMFRQHDNQKTHDIFGQTASLIDTARKLALRADCLSGTARKEIIENLNRYAIEYEKNHWKTSGRLAELGLPRSLVVWLRYLRELARNSSLTSAGSKP